MKLSDVLTPSKPKLDNGTLTFEVNRLHIIAGSTNSGKSLTLQAIACQFARKAHKVMLFTTDGTHTGTAFNILSNLAGVAYNKNAQFQDPDAVTELNKAAAKYSSFIEMSPQVSFEFSVHKLLEEIRAAQANGTTLFLIDDLGSLFQDNSDSSFPAGMNQIVRQLIEIAHVLQITIIATSSKTRQGDVPAYLLNRLSVLWELPKVTPEISDGRCKIAVVQGSSSHLIELIAPLL